MMAVAVVVTPVLAMTVRSPISCKAVWLKISSSRTPPSTPGPIRATATPWRPIASVA